MSISSLKKIKKELITIKKSFTSNKFIIKALDGLFLIDLSKVSNEDGKLTSVNVAPEDMDIIIIDDVIDDIVICGSDDAPVIIYGENYLID